MTVRKAARNTRAILTIEGECARPRAFSYHDLSSIHEYYQVPEVAKVDERLRGKAVRLRKLIESVGPAFHARFITVESEDGSTSTCLPLAETARTALVVYELKGKPLERVDGGPACFVVPFLGGASSPVKGAVRLVITEVPARDARPAKATQPTAVHTRAT